MRRNSIVKSVLIVLLMLAFLLSTACAGDTSPESAPEQPALESATAPEAPAAEPAAAPEEAAAAPVEDEKTPILENEHIRIFFTGYAAADGEITLRIENKMDRSCLVMAQTGDEPLGALHIDNTEHQAYFVEMSSIPVGESANMQIIAVTGPDAEGYLQREPLPTDAKMASVIPMLGIYDGSDAGHTLVDENGTISLPDIDLTKPVFFPLPGISEFSGTTLSGEPIDGSYFTKNTLTMVNYWATWCGPCISEMPDISKLSEAYADKGLGVLGVLVWDEGNEQGALDYLTENAIAYPVVAYNTIPAFSAIADTQDAIPFTVFYNGAGEQVGDVVVGSRDYSGWASLVDQLLLTVG